MGEDVENILLKLIQAADFDVKKAEELGIRAVDAPGLAGKYAPQALAELTRDAVYAALGEWL